MSDTEPPAPRNRKERRAAAKTSNTPIAQPTHLPRTRKTPRSASDIPMAQPDRRGPQGKTLYEIADERMQALQAKGQPFSKVHSDGQVRDESGNILTSLSSSSALTSDDDDSPIGPFGDAVFLTTSLSMIHFTLDVLVYNQYMQTIEWPAIISRTLQIFPVLLTLIYLLHTETARAFHLPRQMFFFATAVVSGCYMIYAGNTADYFAVMKRAPPLGALWIWSTIEMRVWWGVGSLVVDAGFLVWGGYSVF